MGTLQRLAGGRAGQESGLSLKSQSREHTDIVGGLSLIGRERETSSAGHLNIRIKIDFSKKHKAVSNVSQDCSGLEGRKGGRRENKKWRLRFFN